jgi:hypothetical protein
VPGLFLKYIYNVPKIMKKSEIESAARKTGRVSNDKSKGYVCPSGC